VTVSGLTNGMSYDLKLRAVNAVGSGDASDEVSFTMPLAPDAPTQLVGIADDGAAIFRFTAGSSNGGAITKYQYTTDDGAHWADAVAGTSSPVRVTGLTNGHLYKVKLRAVNFIGPGAESDEVSVTPTNVGASWTATGNLQSSDDWVSVAWDGSLSLFVAVGSGGGIVTSPDGVTWTAREVDGSHQWTSITVRSSDSKFVAVAADGYTMTSVNGVSWVLHATDGSPAWRSVTVGSNGLFVAVGDADHSMTSTDGASWSIEVGPLGRNWTSVISASSNRFLAVSSDGWIAVSLDGGLSWGNESGNGSPTGALNSPISWSSVAYSPARGLYVAVGSDGYIAVSADGYTWFLSVSHESSSWTSVRSCQGIFVAVSSDGPYGVATSTDGNDWLARSSSSASQWSSLACGNGVTVAVARSGGSLNGSMRSGSWRAPLAPTGLVATVGSKSVSISFTSGSARVSGSPTTTKFQYQLNGTGDWKNFLSTGSPVKVSGLTNGTSYTIRIRGVNNGVQGLSSVALRFTPRGVPSAPGRPVLDEGGAGSVTVHWAAPGSTGGSAITGYVVSAYLPGSKNRTGFCSTSSTSCTISGLSAGVAYDISAVAVNAVGSSAASSKLSVDESTVTNAKPSAPTFQSLSSPTSGAVKIILGQTSANGSTILSYRITAYLRGGASTGKFCLAGPIFRTCTITGLTPAVAYIFHATAVNGLGRSNEGISSQYTVPVG
jgi:titin